MDFRIVSLIACVACLLLALSTQALSSKLVFSATPSQTKQQLSLPELRDHARSITVKVITQQGWGSGILIQKNGLVYTVLTNAHVLRIGSSYQIQTPDGKVHAAQAIKSANFQDDDLALVNFTSADNYQLATFTSSFSLAVGDETFAAGFPDEQNQFVFTTGKVDYVLPQAFLGGYQLGYSNDIFKGMSGGPVLNRQGELVAINGKHKHPLWGNSYIFKDGSTPNSEVRQKLVYSSWAVPIQTFLQQSKK
ncbi:S1 family peptidase [Iningainema tapete]|uniref:Trypsin-like peptidase domain-containing protein n=1 Tax=Iningainema tapete BLCC-T55 TaxID=2748662 RepID=A0A8J7C6Y3_9CYAN|nr:serine protease [Iningainema tapete]MBD2774944.1 trypsin-like peptidase domain-containing protein [Iningainema tapete BLCC-T55]